MGNSWSCRSCNQCRQCTSTCAPCAKLVQQSQTSTNDGVPLQHYPVSGLEFPLEQHVCGDFVEPVEAVNTNEITSGGRKATGPFVNFVPMTLDPKATQIPSIGGRSNIAADIEEKQANAEQATQIPNIGCRRSIADLEEECRFNSAKVQRVRSLSKSYTHWRPIRGDGNCFYRTVIFGALETLLAAGDFFRVGQLVHVFQEVHFEKSEEQHAHEKLLSNLEAIGNLNPNQLEHWIATDSLMDQAFIRAARRLVRLFLLHRADSIGPIGLTYTELAQALSSNYQTMEDFCNDVVDPMGRDVETLAVEALPQKLGVGLRLWILDRRDEVDLTNIDIPTPDGKVDVHVLFKPGHYDLLYPKQK